MRRNHVVRLLSAAGLAALVPLATVNAQTLNADELAAVVGKEGFEFRGQQVMWKFAANGAVHSEHNSYRATQGAGGEVWGLKAHGTWRRDGEKLCIKWANARDEECYTVARSRAGLVTLAGPRMIVGTLHGSGTTVFAETPVRPAPPLGYRYQRIPGAR